MSLPFRLRPTSLADVGLYAEFLADPEVTIWLDDFFQRPVTTCQVEDFLRREAWCQWAIESKGRFVGLTSLYEPVLTRGTARFFILIGDRTCWRKGLGTAVLNRVLGYGFVSLGLRRINSDYLEPNEASRVIHERAGFTVDGRQRKDVWRRGRWVDRILLSIFREEFFERNPNLSNGPEAEGRCRTS